MSGFIIDSDITQARTLRTEFYTQPSYFEEAREKIFGRSWQFLGSIEAVKDPGSCLPLTLLENYLDEPLLITHTASGNLHCLSNVCTHRGNLLVTSPCQGAHIRCGYHGRLFGLDGHMISMPEFEEVKNFPSSADNLVQLPLYRIGNWLFTSLNPEQDPNLFFGEMKERLSWLPMEEFKFRSDLSTNYTIQAHWALYCENYLEGFHIPFVHPGLNAVIDYGEYSTELFRYSNLQLGVAKKNECVFDLPVSSADYGKQVAAYYFWVFPNMMFNFYPWGLSVNLVQPVSMNQTRVSFLVYVWKEEEYKKGAGGDLHKVEMEDEAVVQQVQKGIRSRFYHQGRYSASREQGIHHFHRLIAEFIN